MRGGEGACVRGGRVMCKRSGGCLCERIHTVVCVMCSYVCSLNTQTGISTAPCAVTDNPPSPHRLPFKTLCQAL